MASKEIFLVAVLCAMQVAHAASVQKRDLVQEALNTYVTVITGIQQMFEAVINQLLSMILNLRSQIASEIASVRAKVSAQFASIIGCATSQAASILNQIDTDILTCGAPVVDVFYAFTEAVNNSNQVEPILQGMQRTMTNMNIFNPIPTILTLQNNISTAIQLITNITTDVTYMSTKFPIAVGEIAICGAKAFVTAAAQLITIPANVLSCTQSG